MCNLFLPTTMLLVIHDILLTVSCCILQSQKVFVYDPVLNRSDQEVLERLGVELLQTNEV